MFLLVEKYLQWGAAIVLVGPVGPHFVHFQLQSRHSVVGSYFAGW